MVEKITIKLPADLLELTGLSTKNLEKKSFLIGYQIYMQRERLTDGIPQWQHKCQHCLACINFCPENSIQFGEKTLKTGRYHHPEIKLKEIINQKKI